LFNGLPLTRAILALDLLLSIIFDHTESNIDEGMGCPMLEVERQRLILKLVHDRSVVSVQHLVETLGASEATVRRRY